MAEANVYSISVAAWSFEKISERNIFAMINDCLKILFLNKQENNGRVVYCG